MVQLHLLEWVVMLVLAANSTNISSEALCFTWRYRMEKLNSDSLGLGGQSTILLEQGDKPSHL